MWKVVFFQTIRGSGPPKHEGGLLNLLILLTWPWPRIPVSLWTQRRTILQPDSQWGDVPSPTAFDDFFHFFSPYTSCPKQTELQRQQECMMGRGARLGSRNGVMGSFTSLVRMAPANNKVGFIERMTLWDTTGNYCWIATLLEDTINSSLRQCDNLAISLCGRLQDAKCLYLCPP